MLKQLNSKVLQQPLSVSGSTKIVLPMELIKFFDVKLKS